jgi:sugar phosphate isomerase/epimerase
MHTFSRREFIAASAAGIAAAGARELRADPLGLPVGFQVYPIRELIAKDFAGTLRQMASIGYRSVEMCSPPGYQTSGFGPLMSLTASQMRQTIQAAGLICESCHYQFREMKENLDDRLAYARELGLKQMIVASFGLRQDATLSDWARAAEEMNKIGEQTRKAGIQLGFHNHHFEFREIDGVLIYDKLMSVLDPKLVKMQFQVAVISLGYQAVTFFRKYPGRFVSLHLADWSSAERKAVPVGKGVVDWKQLFAAAKPAGVKNYYVEMEMDALKASYPYLHALKV